MIRFLISTISITTILQLAASVGEITLQIQGRYLSAKATQHGPSDANCNGRDGTVINAKWILIPIGKLPLAENEYACRLLNVATNHYLRFDEHKPHPMTDEMIHPIDVRGGEGLWTALIAYINVDSSTNNINGIRFKSGFWNANKFVGAVQVGGDDLNVMQVGLPRSAVFDIKLTNGESLTAQRWDAAFPVFVNSGPEPPHPTKKTNISVEIRPEDIVYSSTCPYCGIGLEVRQQQMNCGIFRCGVYKTGEPINPHTPRWMIAKLKTDDSMHGCGGPFEKTDGPDGAMYFETCEYK